MRNDRLNDALKQTYASAPAHAIELNTLELRHPAFRDDDGNNVPLRVVANTEGFYGTLEDDAPVNAGEKVLFSAVAFELGLPEISPQGVPEVSVSIDNVSGEIWGQIREATKTNAKTELTYRPFLAHDSDTPQVSTPLTLTVNSASVSVETITFKASVADIANKAFPRAVYSAQKYPALVQ